MNDIFVVPLTNSDQICIIDVEDSERVMQHKWHYCNGTGYIRCTKKKFEYRFLHRFILNIFGFVIDHINDQRFDARKINLRQITTGINQQRKSKYGKNPSSKYKGVYVGKDGKFKVSFYFNGKHRHLGTFSNEINAAQAYNNEAIKFYGEHCYLNKI